MPTRRRSSAAALACAAALLAGRPAHAVTVSVTVDEDLARAAGLDAQDMSRQLESMANEELRLDDQQAYLEQMALAAISATKGMGADYASNPQRFVVGASLGSAANGSGVQFSRDPEGLPEAGFAFQAMAMAGFNLGFAAGDESLLRRLVLTVNGMTAGNSREPFSADLYNYGAHLQVKLVRPPREGPVEWGGLDLTSGYEVSNYRLQLSHPIPIPADEVSWDATGTYEITASATSVPVELSTNLRVLVATVFAGAAVDVNLEGAAVSEIGLSGDITTDAGGQTTTIGSATISHADRGVAASQTARLFGGLQANVFMVKAYGHFNLGLDGSYGGHVGVRVAM